MTHIKTELERHAIDFCFLFDIDGVLCEPQKPVSPEIINIMHCVARRYQVYMVTGNSFLKAADLLNGVTYDGIFCNSASELRSKSGRLLWKDTETEPLPPELETTLYHICANKKVEHFGNRVEWRSPSMINFSLIGRNAPHSAREGCDTEWRIPTKNLLEILHPSVRVDIGGATSIDIHSEGADKSRAAKVINDVMCRRFVFLGDKTQKGGNDYPIVEYCEKNPHRGNFALTVTDPAHTIDVLKGIL